MERHPMESDRAGRCYTCEAGGDRMEEIAGVHLVSNDETRTWPTIVVQETECD